MNDQTEQPIKYNTRIAVKELTSADLGRRMKFTRGGVTVEGELACLGFARSGGEIGATIIVKIAEEHAASVEPGMEDIVMLEDRDV